MNIRTYQTADLPALRALLAEQQAFERSLDPYSSEPTEATIDTYFSDMLGWVPELNGAVYVAETAGMVAGFVCVLILTNNDSWTTIHRHAHISNVIVAAEYRGAGLGQALLAAAEAYARAQGCEHLTIDVLVENALAQKAYQRFGFHAREIQMHKALT